MGWKRGHKLGPKHHAGRRWRTALGVLIGCADDAFAGPLGAATGFSRAVRLPVRWRNHADADAQARIDPVFLACVEGRPLDPNEQAVPDELVQRRFFAF